MQLLINGMSRWQPDTATQAAKHRAQTWRLDLQVRLWDRSRKKAARPEFSSQHRDLPAWRRPIRKKDRLCYLLGTVSQAILDPVPLTNLVAFL